MSNGANNQGITRAEFLEFKGDVKQGFAELRQEVSEIRRDMSNLRNWVVGTSLSVVTVALAAIGTFGTLLFQVFDKLQ